MERKTDDLGGRSKRNNLILSGIPRHENKTQAECEGVLNDIIVDKLELTGSFEFDHVHRLNSKTNSPVIARSTFFKDKQKILKAKVKLKGTQMYVGEDFSLRVREIRKNLTPHSKKARSEGFFVYYSLAPDFGLWTLRGKDTAGHHLQTENRHHQLYDIHQLDRTQQVPIFRLRTDTISFMTSTSWTGHSRRNQRNHTLQKKKSSKDAKDDGEGLATQFTRLQPIYQDKPSNWNPQV
ncbi:hypothetical protein ACOMHN_019076 [Nucella lapillus]